MNRMTQRPDILFLAHRVPYPPDRGDRIRSWNMLRFLAERANIHLACTTEEPVAPETLGVLNDYCERVHIQPLPCIRRWIRGAASLAAGRSVTEGLFASRQLKQVVAAWSRETCFDAVFVFCSSMFQYALDKNLQPARLVVDLVDVDSEKFVNYAETAPLGKRQLYRLEARRVRRLETAIARRADAVTLVSDDEVSVFRRFCTAGNVQAVQNGVDLEYFHPAASGQRSAFSDQPEGIGGRRSEVGGQRSEVAVSDSQLSTLNSQPFRLVFTGVLDYRANVEGLRWFCRDVWPKVRERMPHAEFHIVGRGAGEAVRKLARQPGVTLVGEVPDVRPPVWNADVVIAPLTIARGIQNKVLEAMAMAKPIVATPQAIEGTGAVPGEHLLSASTPHEWAAALAELHADPARRESLGRAARADAETRCAWSARLESLADLLELHPQHMAPSTPIRPQREPSLTP
jgi:glycosyltransferase involved in cell wall biosynthesis